MSQLEKSSLLDSSQIIVEIQLKLIYYLESVLAFFKSHAVNVLNECTQQFNSYFGDSFLFSVIYQCKTYLLNNQARRVRLLKWLQDKLRPPFTPTNFNSDWRDGIRLCALCEAISPGACPRYDLLSPSNAQNNIKLARNLIQAYLYIKPNITTKEIYECSSEAKLVHLLSQIKIAFTKKFIKSTGSSWLKIKQSSSHEKEAKALHLASSSDFFLNRCFVKGMGLISGVRSRRARFSIYYYEPLPKISLFFEIVGPNESFCSEKVVAEFNNFDTDDEEKETEKQLENQSYDEVQSLIMRAAMQRKATEKNLKIPFFCKIFPDHILITYIPLFTGDHVISIIWQGQHVLNSPYTVPIEESEYLENEVRDIGPKFEPGFQYPLCLFKSHKNSELDDMGTVVRTKVVKKSIVSNGNEFDYNNYFESNFSPNFLKYPNDPHVLEYKPRKSLSVNESISTSNSQNSNLNTPFGNEKSSNRKNSDDSDKANIERTTVKTTKFVERKVSFEESKVKITEKVAEGKPKASSNESANEFDRSCIPQLRVDSPDSNESVSNCTSPCKTPSLKEIMSENSKQFNENMEKLRKSLEQNLHRYKAQLESST